MLFPFFSSVLSKCTLVISSVIISSSFSLPLSSFPLRTYWTRAHYVPPRGTGGGGACARCPVLPQIFHGVYLHPFCPQVRSPMTLRDAMAVGSSHQVTRESRAGESVLLVRVPVPSPLSAFFCCFFFAEGQRTRHAVDSEETPDTHTLARHGTGCAVRERRAVADPAGRPWQQPGWASQSQSAGSGVDLM